MSVQCRQGLGMIRTYQSSRKAPTFQISADTSSDFSEFQAGRQQKPDETAQFSPYECDAYEQPTSKTHKDYVRGENDNGVRQRDPSRLVRNDHSAKEHMIPPRHPQPSKKADHMPSGKLDPSVERVRPTTGHHSRNKNQNAHEHRLYQERHQQQQPLSNSVLKGVAMAKTREVPPATIAAHYHERSPHGQNNHYSPSGQHYHQPNTNQPTPNNQHVLQRRQQHAYQGSHSPMRPAEMGPGQKTVSNEYRPNYNYGTTVNKLKNNSNSPYQRNDQGHEMRQQQYQNYGKNGSASSRRQDNQQESYNDRNRPPYGQQKQSYDRKLSPYDKRQPSGDHNKHSGQPYGAHHHRSYERFLQDSESSSLEEQSNSEWSNSATFKQPYNSPQNYQSISPSYRNKQGIEFSQSSEDEESMEPPLQHVRSTGHIASSRHRKGGQIERRNPNYGQNHPEEQNRNEELIAEHSKRDFKGNLIKETTHYYDQQTIDKPKSHVRTQEGVIQSRGGISFELDVRQFKAPIVPPTTQANYGPRTIASPYYHFQNRKPKQNSREEILRRRQTAKAYDRKTRFRIFGPN